jgi:DNA-binding GntR family transcriptional regulator
VPEPDWQKALRGVLATAASNGLPLPTEQRLVEELGVSKPSVREALIRLEAEGLVARRVGVGTFPNPMAPEMPARLDRQADFADLLRSAGFEPRVEVLEAGWTELRELAAQRLGCESGTRAFRTRKRWFADDVPVMVAVDVVPAPRPVTTTPDPSTTLVTLADELGAGRAEWILTWPGASICGHETAKFLGLRARDPVLTLEHVGVNRLGGRCFWATEHHRPGHIGYGWIMTL